MHSKTLQQDYTADISLDGDEDKEMLTSKLKELCSQKDPDQKVIAALVRAGANFNAIAINTGLGEQTLFEWAAAHNFKELAQALLRKGADTKLQNGFSVLHVAASNDSHDVAKLLIEHKVNFDDNDNIQRYTPLHWASLSQKGSCVDLLLEARANTALETHDGLTPLDNAFAMNNIPVALKLMESSDVQAINKVDENGMSPLHYAVENQILEFVHALIKKRAEVNARDAHDRTPLRYICDSYNNSVRLYTAEDIAEKDLEETEAKFSVIALMLISAGATFNDVLVSNRNNQGSGLLQWSVDANHTKLIHAMLASTNLSFVGGIREELVDKVATGVVDIDILQKAFERLGYPDDNTKGDEVKAKFNAALRTAVRSAEGRGIHVSSFVKAHLARELDNSGQSEMRK